MKVFLAPGVRIPFSVELVVSGMQVAFSSSVLDYLMAAVELVQLQVEMAQQLPGI